MTSTLAPHRGRPVFILLAALTLAGFLSQPAAHANGPPLFLDVNGTTAGFGSPSGTITDSWTTSSAGTTSTTSWVANDQMTFGATLGGSDFSGRTFTLGSFTGTIGGVQINSTAANITLAGSNNNPLNAAQIWSVTSGSTFTSNVTWNLQSNGYYLGVNCNGQNLTLRGGGTFNFLTEIGANSGGTVTQGTSASDANLTVNLAFTPGSATIQANYSLAFGTLNFANGGTNAFGMLGTVSGGGTTFTINGGTINNTSGSPMTLGLGSGHYSIGGDFTFTGSSDLDLGTYPVTLTASPTLVVSNANLTIGGIISGSGFGLTKTGLGTLKLTGTNSFTGPTVVNQGTLRIATPAALALPAGLKIMPLGDSITLGDGSSSGAGYRYPLYVRLNPLAPSLQFVGATNVSSGPLPATPFDERWHNGRESYSCNDINNNLDGLDTATFNLYGGAGRDPNGGYWLTGGNGTGRAPVYPDAILLLVGANDINRVGMTGVQTRIESLLTKITTLRPAARVFLARCTPYLSYPADVSTFNGIIDTVSANFRAAGKSITVVDLNTNFPANGLSGDGVHPSDAGYSWMADRWYDALVSVYGAYPPVGNSLALASSSSVTVATGARLEGAGQITGPLNVAGTLAPGSATATGPLSAGATTLTGTYACTLDSNSSSQLAVTGDLDLTNSTLAVSQLATPGVASYVIASYTGTLHGSFSSMTGLPSGYTLQYDASGGRILLATNFTGPVRLAISQINGGVPVAASSAFSVVVQALNFSSVPAPVAANTSLILSLKTGSGSLAGSLTGTILAGQSQATLSGATYSKAESGVVITATRSSGDVLLAANSGSFTVTAGAVSGSSSTLTATPNTVMADGISISTIAVTLSDGGGNAVAGKTVTLARNGNTGLGTPAIIPLSVTTSAAGVATFAVTCTTLGAYDFQATGDGILISQKASVTFSVASPTPGGVSSGLAVWLKADAINAADATQVQTAGGNVYLKQWNDQSGNLQHATQATLANEPLYLTGNLNGLPTVKWDGTGRFMRGPSNTTAQTIFAVCKVDANATGLDGMFCQSASQDSKNIRGSSSQWNADAWQADGNDFAHGGQIYVNGTSGYTHNGQWHVLMETSAASAVFTYQFGQIAYNRFFNGRIAEFIIYNRTLTAAEQNLVGGYLAAKYALSTAYPPPLQTTPYATWANGTFANGILTDKDPNHDPDGDGMTNFQEFAFGLDPTTGTSRNPITRQLDRTTGTFKYTRRKDSGLSYVYQSSTTLGAPWAAITPLATASNNASPVEEITVTLPPSLLTNPKLFLRIKAE